MAVHVRYMRSRAAMQPMAANRKVKISTVQVATLWF
jgi:hypothetical protein